jgi:hypothetical protein
LGRSFLYRVRSFSSSVRDTRTSFRARDLNRSIGVSAEFLTLTPALSGWSIWFFFRVILARQLRVCQPLPGNGGYHLSEPSAVLAVTFVEPKGLLIEVSAKVNRINAHEVPLRVRFKRLQKFSMLLVWTLPRTNSIAWSIISWV